MADNYDGSIRIDTAIDTAPLDSGLEQIGSKIKSLAETVGLAFGVKELIDFSKRSVDAASDLAEAQNVVDTAFGEMSYKMELFASTALDVYGISELTAKNMGSTYMAMAKGMGVATDAASDMAVTLTGRLSDIMSFYNKTQSEVDTIGRALITGETEPLKAIGVVMTQTNLSAYAMAQGFSKTYTEMSSNEQLLVRYKYFLEQTALAQGDFAKTSEGWANQTRLLSERINEFMTNLGGLIINTLTPALQFANEAVTFLNDLFFHNKNKAEDASAVKNAEAVTDEVTAMGAAAEKSEKKLNNLLSGFDELHIISGAKADDDNEVEGAGIDTSDLLGVNLEADTTTAKSSAKKYREIINEIYLAFKTHPLTKTVEDIIKKLGEFFGFFDGKGIDAGKLTGSLMDILQGILAFKAVTGAVKGVISIDKALASLHKTSRKFGAGFGKLIGLITAHPIAAATVGLTALAIGIYTLDKQLEHQRIVECFGDISISLDEIDELISPITGDIDKVAEAFADSKQRLNSARDDFNEVAQAVQKTADAFKKGNTKQDVESFAKQLDDFVDSALELNSANFDTSPYEQLFLSDDVIDDEEREILDRMKNFGGTIADKITACNKGIQSICETAIKEERELLESELEDIQRLYSEIAKMTQTQENVKTSATWERLKNGAYSYDSYAELSEQIKAAQEQAEKSRQETEQSFYEDIMYRAALMEQNGASAEEISRMKEQEFKKVAESINQMALEEKRYVRDILLAYTQGAFTDMAKSYTADPEQLDIMRKYFDLIVSAPDDIDPKNIFEGIQLDSNKAEALYRTEAVLNDIKKNFGLDFTAEWKRLNDEIGDNIYSVEDFNDAVVEALDSVTTIDLDQILPKAEAFKKRSDEYRKILTDFAAYSEYEIRMGVKLDTSEVDELIKRVIEDNGFESTLSISPSQSSDTRLPDKLMNSELSGKFSGSDLLSSIGAVLPTQSWFSQKPTTLDVRIFNDNEQVVSSKIQTGTNSTFEVDNGKSSSGWRFFQ